MKRIPRDVSIHLFKATPRGFRYLMLRRPPARGGFWQSVTGAPLAGETDTEAAIREVHEETGYEISASIISLGVSYSYALRPELADRWRTRYGPGVTAISVVAFGAEVPAAVEPVLDPTEHDSYAWSTYEQAYALLEWPIESDALPGRRKALSALADRIGDQPPKSSAAGTSPDAGCEPA
jgi:dihydroneopterin triphosphate diphosphatase